MRNRNCEERSGRKLSGWRMLWLAAGLLLLLGAAGADAQIGTTTVQGTVYRADGSPASGTALISWGAFTTAQNQAVAAGSLSAAIGTDGFLSVNLTPNAGALPAGSFYTVVYHLSDGTVNREYWLVPASATASIASVRAELQPSTVAVQPVTPAYVNSALASMSSSYLPLNGGTMNGPLTLSSDPTAQDQAATKHYADQIGAQSLPLSGGTLNGPLDVPSLDGSLMADQQPGSDASQKILAALNQVSSTGQLVDGFGFTGSQTWSRTVLITQPGADIRLGCATYQGTSNLTSTLTVTSVSTTANLGSGAMVTLGVTLTGGEAPVSGGIVSVTGTSSANGEFNISGIPIASSSFTGNSGTVSFLLGPLYTATWSSGSTTLTVFSTQNLAVGMVAQGTGIPTGDTIASIGTGTVTLAAATTAAGTGVPVLFTPAALSTTSDSGTMSIGNPMIAIVAPNVSIQGCSTTLGSQSGSQQGGASGGTQLQPYGAGGGIYVGTPSLSSVTNGIVSDSVSDVGVVAQASNTPTYAYFLQFATRFRFSRDGFFGNGGAMARGYWLQGAEQGVIDGGAYLLDAQTDIEAALFTYGGTANLANKSGNAMAAMNGVKISGLSFDSNSAGGRWLLYDPYCCQDTHVFANHFTRGYSAASGSGIDFEAADAWAYGVFDIFSNHIESFSHSASTSSGVFVNNTQGVHVHGNLFACAPSPYSCIDTNSGNGVYENNLIQGEITLESSSYWNVVKGNFAYPGSGASIIDSGVGNTVANNPSFNVADIHYASGYLDAQGNTLNTVATFGPKMSNATGTPAGGDWLLRIWGQPSSKSAQTGIWLGDKTGSWNELLECNGSTSYCQAGEGSSSGSLTHTDWAWNASSFAIRVPLQVTGSLSVTGLLDAQSSLTGASINGEVTVDGATYKTLNAAWTAAASQAVSTGQDQTVRLGPGTYPVSATLTEPTNGACVNLIGSGGTTLNADSPQVATTLTVPNPLNGDVVYLGNTSQAQGCTFSGLNVLAQNNATHGFELQWFRGLLMENVAVDDTSSDGIVLGEENTASGHQSNFLLRNVTVSFSSAVFTPANRPAYGLHIEKTAIDSSLDNITVRNALTASVYNEGTGNTGYLIHGFGYPYTCTTAPCSNSAASGSAANASYATSYVIYDTGGSGTEWTDTYVDSPAVAGFYVGANGVSIEGGHIQWPDLTSFPAANLAYVASSVTNNMLIGDVSCLGMASGTNWITYANAPGTPPTFSSVHHLTGCGNYYQALEPAVTTGFSSGGANINDLSGAVPRVWATPLAASSTDAAYAAQMYTGYQGDAYQAHFSGSNPFFNVTYQGTIRSNGGLAMSTVLNTASTLTLTVANKNVIANAASGPQTITLPSCYTPMPDKMSPTGLELTIIKSDSSSNAVTLQTVSSQNIDYNGVSAQTLAITSAGKRTLICGPDYNWYAY